MMILLRYAITHVNRSLCKKTFTDPQTYYQSHLQKIYLSKNYNSLIHPNCLKYHTKLLHTPHILWNHINVPKQFHTSQSKYALPGFVYLLFKPVLRFGAIIIARMSRKWWAKLTPEQKKLVYSYIARHQSKIISTSLISIGLTYIYYFLHLETCPITGRQKFIIVKPSQLKEMAALAKDSIIDEYGNKVLTSRHPLYSRAGAVVKQILDANKVYTDHFNYKYPITIIDEPTMNAFVLPDGSIFIFTGLFQVCQTDDELATILAHELSHTLLKHVAEKISNKTLLEILYIVPLMIIWFLLPDFGALLTHLLLDELKSVMFELPYERYQESEADAVGLKLMARACYDVRVAPLFWEKMAIKEDQEQVGPKVHEYLSTHPSHENRAINLESKIKEAIEIRKECNCFPLGPLFYVPRFKPLVQILRPAPPA